MTAAPRWRRLRAEIAARRPVPCLTTWYRRSCLERRERTRAYHPRSGPLVLRTSPAGRGRRRRDPDGDHRARAGAHPRAQAAGRSASLARARDRGPCARARVLQVPDGHGGASTTGGVTGMAMLVVFEGIDGSGKTTISNRVADELRRAGRSVRHVREGGQFASRVTQSIRDVCRDARNLALAPRTELLLYLAREVQLLEEIVRPALAETEVVIADRFIYTAEVLAQHGRGLPADVVGPIVAAARAGGAGASAGDRTGSGRAHRRRSVGGARAAQDRQDRRLRSPIAVAQRPGRQRHADPLARRLSHAGGARSAALDRDRQLRRGPRRAGRAHHGADRRRHRPTASGRRSPRRVRRWRRRRAARRRRPVDDVARGAGRVHRAGSITARAASRRWPRTCWRALSGPGHRRAPPRAGAGRAAHPGARPARHWTTTRPGSCAGNCARWRRKTWRSRSTAPLR